jgi:hypothetical protein
VYVSRLAVGTTVARRTSAAGGDDAHRGAEAVERQSRRLAGARPRRTIRG